jgi:hypothetical protein
LAKFRSIKNTLAGGQISADAMGRTDLEIYKHSCKTLKNMIPLLSGGATRRPGTYHETYDAVGYGSYASRLLPFIYSESESYCVRICRINSTNYTKAIRINTNHSGATHNSVTYAHDYQPATVNYISSPDSYNATIGYYDEWHSVQYAQSADVMWTVHQNRKPLRLTRTSVNTFNFKVFDDHLAAMTAPHLMNGWPYLPQNTTSTTITPSATTGSITLTASSATFSQYHVGAIFKLNHAGTIGAAQITAYTSATSVTATVITNLGATSAVTTWWESAWSNYRGWPGSVCFYSGRLLYLGSRSYPDTIWCSQTENFNVMSAAGITLPNSEPTGAQPFTITLNSQEMNAIQWGIAGEQLIVGTQGSEWIITPVNGSFACGSVSAVSQTSYGSSYHQAIRAGNEVFFISADETKIRSLSLNKQENQWYAEELNPLFTEYPKIEKGAYGTENRKIRQMAWDKGRSTLWVVDSAGSLYSLTRDKKSGINAWATHEMGGYNSSQTGGTLGSGGTLTTDPAYTNCNGSVVSVAVVPNQFTGSSDVWLCVKRYVNSAWLWSIERMIGCAEVQDTAYSALPWGTLYTDDSLQTTNTYPSVDYTMSAGWLEGVTPKMSASNSKGIFSVDMPTVASADSTIQTPYPGGYETETTRLGMGYAYTSIVEPVRLEAGSQIGTAHGAIKRIHQIIIRFYRTLAATVGADSSSNTEAVIFRDASTPMGKSAEVYSGDKLIKLDSDYDRDGYIAISTDDALPMTVSSIICEGITYD